MGNSAHCKTFCGKANRTFLVAAEEKYDSSLQRRELLPHLLSRPCKRRLKTRQCLKLSFRKVRDLFRTSQVKKCTEKSRSALRSLKTSKATDSSVARASRDTRRELDFEFREPNPKLKSSCNIWQILIDDRMTLRASPGQLLRTRTHFNALLSHFRS